MLNPQEILTLLPKPSHFAGTEWGAIRKESRGLLARMALAFPDLYEVGMSYFGGRVLYDAVNRQQDLLAERVFAPSREAAQILRGKNYPLFTLESHTPLAEMDVIGFHLTHELAYTNVLYMLDLAGLPLFSAQREKMPLIMAGGGCSFSPEPLAPFIDLFVLGDGEVILPELLGLTGNLRKQGQDRKYILERLAKEQGVYVPGLQDPAEVHIKRRVVADLETVPHPTHQVVSGGQNIHDRLTLEIARGCSNGCRFCQAGMIGRPVRERSVEGIVKLAGQGLETTGFEELALLSLSTGDYSALEKLFARLSSFCLAEQVAISLPSLRAGTLTSEMLRLMSKLRRTGATVAPEAATQRLRDVINKGIDEETILEHAQLLFTHGWQNLKMYFMIGLPTETDEDVLAIYELCRKILQIGEKAGLKNKIQRITASISPFVPKPHTPFQWEAQISLEETKRRLELLKGLFAKNKRLVLRWHDPNMTWLEGVFARGDRNLSSALLRAYELGAIFDAWADSFNPHIWRQAFLECNIEPELYHGARSPEARLPWDHLDSGVSRDFLLKEREKALGALKTPDCRRSECSGCGACDFKKLRPLIANTAILVSENKEGTEESLDQENIQEEDFAQNKHREEMTRKVSHLRIWYSKTDEAIWLSQLELVSIFERACRRAGLLPTFSGGFHPLPLISFGRALSVGVSSLEECLGIFLRVPTTPEETARALSSALPAGLKILRAENLPLNMRLPIPAAEEYCAEFQASTSKMDEIWQEWSDFLANETFPVTYAAKKGPRTLDLREVVTSVTYRQDINALNFIFSWEKIYLGPLKIISLVNKDLNMSEFRLSKIKQFMD